MDRKAGRNAKAVSRGRSFTEQSQNDEAGMRTKRAGAEVRMCSHNLIPHGNRVHLNENETVHQMNEILLKVSTHESPQRLRRNYWAFWEVFFYL